MFRFPFGTTQELNLDWFLEQWEVFKQEAQTAFDGIDHALDDEIQRVEDAMTDLYAARDAAISAKNDALDYAQSANSSAIGASQSAQNSAASAVTSAQQAQSAAQSAQSAAQSVTDAHNEALQAAAEKYLAQAWATGYRGSAPVAPVDPQYHNNSKYYAEYISRAWANGTNPDGDVSATDPAYHNNAKYWSDIAKGFYEDTLALIESLPADVSEILDLYETLAPLAESEELSGNIVDFESSFSGAPLKKVYVPLEPVQEGSGVPSPDNVRPISGHTECNVTRTGANLWSNDKTKSGKILMFPQFGSAAGVYNSSSNSNLIKVLAGETYYVRIEAAEMDSTWGVFGATKSVNAQINHSAMGSNSVRYFTFTPTVDDYWAIWLYKETNWTEEEANAVKIQVTKEYYDYYVPYTGTTYHITFPSGTGTVYSGHITIEQDGSCSLVVDMGYVDLGTLTWSKSQASSGYRFTSYADNVKPNASASAVPNCLCSEYNTISPNETWSGETGISINISSGQLLLRDPSKEEMSVADFQTDMSGVQLVYELNTPITVPLIALQITTLKGINYMWADTGAITVIIGDYVETITANLNKGIPKNILGASVETDYAATANYAVNDFIVIGQTLYRVTAIIANGGTITPGTNVVATTICGEITALLNT